MSLAYTEIARNKRRSYFLLFLFMCLISLMGFFLAVLLEGNGIIGLIMASVVSLIIILVTYFQGGRIALASSGAKPIEKRDNWELYNIVENLSIAAGLPTPKIHLINSSAMNAFATGRDPEHASVAVTTGLLEKLDKKELEGVIAHELSHIGNYDIRLMMIVMVLAGTVMTISRWMIYMRHGGGGGRRDGRVQLVLFIVAILFIGLSPVFATLIKMAISRKREYLADASGALLTRYPEGLASALEKISADHTPAQFASSGTAHLYISNPLRKSTWSKWFSTHPPTDDRIAKLREMNLG